LEELRRAPFMAKLYEWAPKPESDADYTQFLKDTGFDYERDLHRIALATKKKGQDSVIFAIADGKFDRAKISAYASRFGALEKKGGHEIYSVPASGASKKVSFTFLKNDRIVLTGGPDIGVFLNENNRKEVAAEWRTRFESAGRIPVFAISLIQKNQPISGPPVSHNPVIFEKGKRNFFRSSACRHGIDFVSAFFFRERRTLMRRPEILRDQIFHPRLQRSQESCPFSWSPTRCDADPVRNRNQCL